MDKLLITLGFMFTVCCCLGQSDISKDKKRECCASKYPKEQLDSLEINKLGAEYQRLKRAKCKACDLSGSVYVSIMTMLEIRMNGKTAAQIIEVMGNPDTIKDGNYIYFWRNWHDDYLYFSFHQGKAKSQWHYALE